MKENLFSRVSHFFRKHISTSGTLLISFLLVIGVGTLLLGLPIAHAEGSEVAFLDSLFTATSATCVTGLMTIVAGSDLTLFGQIVLLLLIQIGGLGLMSFMGIIIIMSKNKLDYNSQNILQSGLNKENLSNIASYLKSIFSYTMAFEICGFIIMALALKPGSAYGYFQIFFLSVSAFCNAGIDLYGATSLLAYQSNVIVNLVVCALIIFGGLGFAVYIDIRDTFKRSIRNHNDFNFFATHLSVHSKIVLFMTALLIGTGMILIMILEWNNSLAGFGLSEKIMMSFFNSVTLRTAGFYTINYEILRAPTKFLMIIYMFIGANPGGTAGGMKTTTIFIIIYGIISDLRGNKDINIFDRHIHKSNFIRAVTIMMMYMLTLFAGVTIISCVESMPFLDLLYETTSAIGTVGLSTGITTSLSSISRVVIIALMYIGRLGPVTVGMGLLRKNSINADVRIKYPVTDIIVG